jgi:hypothetical protein
MVSVVLKYFLDILFMVVDSCMKCGELNYLTPHAFFDDGNETGRIKPIRGSVIFQS